MIISLLTAFSADDYQNTDYQLRPIFLWWWEKRYRFGSRATTTMRKAWRQTGFGGGTRRLDPPAAQGGPERGPGVKLGATEQEGPVDRLSDAREPIHTWSQIER
jgi:hypothetical protein